MIPTVAVIPSRYEPERLAALLNVVTPDAEVIVLDNGHEPPFVTDDPRVRVVDARGDSIYRMWNRGWQMAREHGEVNVAVLNDDIEIGPGTLELLARALRADDKIGCVYPDARVRSGPLPRKIGYTTEWDPAGGRSLTGFCFVFKGELDLPPFDEGMEWWYGDSEFDESVKLAGYGVARIDGVPIKHISDAELNDWARRPELKEAIERDGERWAERHDRIVDGRWVPRNPDPRVVFLVPRRKDGGHRDKLWAYCRARWEKYFPDVPIFEGHHDEGPFNRSKAVNRAAALAGEWDVGVIIDSDVILSVSQVRAAIEGASRGKVTWGHRRWRGVREDAAVRIVNDRRDFGPELPRDELDLLVERTNPISWSCCIAVPRGLFDDMGGMDERFKGWGFEDMAFQSLVVGLYPFGRVEGDVVHLWHPRSEERLTNGRASASREYVVNMRLGRRYMVAVRRDYNRHDRPTESDAAEMVRDIENLKRDDHSIEPLVRKYGLPDWSHWWPTLEELRDGAKAAKDGLPGALPGPPVGVTAIMRSGGRAETWPDRSGYLRRALASFNEHVHGPFVQKVVYVDWDNEFHPELNEIAKEAGWYVVGLQKNSGYIAAKRALWSYLERRAVGQYIFSAEDDFTYDRDVDLLQLVGILDAHPEVKQVALLRGAYYPSEIAAGGVLESLKTPVEQVDGFMAHRDHFTDNPSLFRKELVRTPWPAVPSSERRFGEAVLRDPQARFAYLGDGTPWITHIGAVRAGTTY